MLDLVHREQPIPSTPPELRMRLKHLIDLGLIECLGRVRGTQYMLCRKYYILTKKTGVYTRKKGLDKETNKKLLLKHMRDSDKKGSKFYELHQVLPALSRDQVQQLLKELKNQGDIYLEGKTSSSVWFVKPNK